MGTNTKTVRLRFHPQAWINDYAVDVDAEGPTEWEVPAGDVTLPLPDDDDYDSDVLREHDNAPKWVQDWAGPFYVEILNRDELEPES